MGVYKNNNGALEKYSGSGIVDSALSSTSKNPVQNKVIDAKLEELNSDIEEVKALRASLKAYGLVKLTDSAAVTDSTGLALPATEKNASIPGTLANWFSQLNTDLYTNMGFIPNYTYADLPPDRADSGKRTRLVIADGFILSQVWNDTEIERSIDITGYQSQNLDNCFSVPISASDLSFVEKTGLEANLKLNVRFSSDISTGTVLITLPEWYRPWLDSRFFGVGLSADGTVYIATMHLCPNGNITTDSKISSEDTIFAHTTYIWRD